MGAMRVANCQTVRANNFAFITVLGMIALEIFSQILKEATEIHLPLSRKFLGGSEQCIWWHSFPYLRQSVAFNFLWP